MQTAALWEEWADDDDLGDGASQDFVGGEPAGAQFPQGILNDRVELYIDGDWVNITSYVYQRGQVTITRGRSDEGANVETSRCALTLNNRDGRFSPRNPRSPYYGLIGRNTPLRVTVFNLGPPADSVPRFYGEVSSWPARWTTGGHDIWVPVEAAGVLRRLAQGAPELRSAPVRYIPGTSPVAYWPLEDGQLVGSALPLVGTSAMVPFIGTHPSGAVVSTPGWGQTALAPWLAPTVSLSGSSGLTIIWGRVFMAATFTTTWTVDWVHSGGTGAPGRGVDVNPSYLGGATGWPQVLFDPPNRQVTVAMNPTDPEVITTVTTLFDGQAHHVRWTVSQSGTKAAWAVSVDGTSVNSGTTTTNQTVTQVKTVALVDDAESGTEAATGHLAVWTTPPTLADAVDAALGHTGEAAAVRIARLCGEETVINSYIGTAAASTTRPCGPQRPATLLDLLRDAAGVDGGILYEPRDALGLTYRAVDSLYNQDAALALSYTADGEVAPPLEPTDDDQGVRNDVTVTRRYGVASQYTLDTGALSTQSPPAGVGRYAATVELGLSDDDQAADQASWRVHLGTVDEARYPKVSLDVAHMGVHSKRQLQLDTARVDIGDRITISDLPDWLPRPSESLLMQGYSETLNQYVWTIAANCTPETPWHIATIEAVDPTFTFRLETAGSTLVGDHSATTTSLTVASAGRPWIYTGHPAATFPFDVSIQGVRITVSAVTGTTSPQVFTVTRSVDGFDVPLPNSATVTLWHRTYIGL